ncbi:MAG TPA: ABC transporter permease [Bryobacteraceae bacterium]|nr:ABC transporter permease [Bryobacteraceae bacterium]
MRIIDILRLRFRSLFGRTHLDEELDEELQYHLEREIEESVARGMSPSDARWAARRSSCGVEQRREECRDARGLNLIDHFGKDLGFAFRQLRKNPGFTGTAIFVLALGMCASLAIFAFVDAALIKPLPYRDSARLIAAYETNPTFPRSNLSYPDYLDWKQRNRVLRSLDVYQQNPFVLTTPAGALPVPGSRVSAGFFRTLGVVPVLGRDFYPDEDSPSAPQVALLSYAAWQRLYSGRRDVVGQAAILDGFPHVIVGVLPREFHFAPAGRPDFWIAMQPIRRYDLNRKSHAIFGLARLGDGVSLQAALSNLKGIAADLEKQYPESNQNRGVTLVPLTEAITGTIHPMLMVLLGGAGLLLFISAVNVTSLVLLRSQNRQREIAVRTALGASWGRLIAQFTTEALALAAGGGALGVALAGGAIQLLQKLIPDSFRMRLPFLDDLGVNGHVWVVAAAMAALVALLLSLPPCIGIRRSDLRSGLAEAGRGSAGTVWRRFGSHLVVVELATAMVLLIGAGLLSKSVYRLMRVDLGIEPERLITLEVDAPRTVYSTTPKVVALTRRIEAEVENLPGVKSVGMAVNGVPVTSNGNTTWFHIPGRPWHGEHFDAPEREVSPNYFGTLGAKLLRGRNFNESDGPSAPQVTIANRTFARTYFPNEDAVGKQIVEHSGKGVTIPIIGVVDDIREGDLYATIPPVLYFPFEQRCEAGFALVVRTAGGEQGLLPAIAATIRRIEAGIVTRGAMSMLDRIQDSQSAYMHRSLAWLVGGFAAVALLLSAVGLYGVVAYSVNQRNREIGIRTALGASRGAIYVMIMSEAGRLIGLGTAAGIGASIAAAGLMRGLLFGVGFWDIPTLTAVAGVLGTVALLASLIPARRAASVDPVESLRAE